MARILVALFSLLLTRAEAQSVLFDFENATLHSGLPMSLTVGGITAQISATGQGFSIQPANSMGFTPAGFSGNCVYPNSIYAADLLVSFSVPLTNFSILYAPEEYACDSSATMRVTAYMDSTQIGTTTTNAQPGTWPSETLQFGSVQPFNRVVVHYDAPPATGGDWGPIFMADDMAVMAAPPMLAAASLPIVLGNGVVLPGGAFQFGFTNTPSATFTVWAAADPTLPLASWTALGNVMEITPGEFQFTDLEATNSVQRFYQVSAP